MNQQIIQPQERLYYKYRDGAWYTKYTKEEIKAMIDPDDEKTFLWLLEELDYPYIKKIWDKQKQYWQDQSFFGRYLAFMRLYDFRQWTWADSQELNELDFFK